MLITSESIRALNRGFVTRYQLAFNAYTPEYSKFATRVPSNKASNVYGFLGTLPVFKRFVGESVIESLDQSDFAIANEEWDVTVGVPRKDIERDDIASHGLVMAGLGKRGAQLPDKLVYDLLANGFTQKDYTGKNFFDTGKKHSPLKSATFSNKGTQVLAASSLKVGIQTIRRQKDPEGVPFVTNERLTLIVSPDNEWLAREILDKAYLAGGESNILLGAVDLHVTGWLSGPAWFLIAHDETSPALIYQEELAPGFTALTSTTDNEHLMLKKEFLYNGYARASAGYGFPQRAYGSTGVDPVDDDDESGS